MHAIAETRRHQFLTDTYARLSFPILGDFSLPFFVHLQDPASFQKFFPHLSEPLFEAVLVTIRVCVHHFKLWLLMQGNIIKPGRETARKHTCADLSLAVPADVQCGRGLLRCGFAFEVVQMWKQ